MYYERAGRNFEAAGRCDVNFYLNHSMGVEFSLYHIPFPAVSIHSNEAICVAN